MALSHTHTIHTLHTPNTHTTHTHCTHMCCVRKTAGKAATAAAKEKGAGKLERDRKCLAGISSPTGRPKNGWKTGREMGENVEEMCVCVEKATRGRWDCSVFGSRALTMSFVSGYVHSARAQLSAATRRKVQRVGERPKESRGKGAENIARESEYFLLASYFFSSGCTCCHCNCNFNCRIFDGS